MNSEMRLTIVTVAGPGDEELIRKNFQHIAQKNAGVSYDLHVLDNGCFHGHPAISFEMPNVTVHRGQPLDPHKPNACRGSYQHSAALNQFLRDHTVHTPYLLILDPDFFIVRSNWIADVISHMSSRGLAFFGATWHPKWYSKYRYFPCVHCMFIDARKIDCRELDFTPDLVERGAKADMQKGMALPVNKTHQSQSVGVENIVPRQWLPIFLEIVRGALRTLCNAYAEAKQPIPKMLKATMRTMQFADKVKEKLHSTAVIVESMTINRRIIGSAHDTGYLVERQNAGRQHRIETLLPSVRLSKDFTRPRFLTTRWGKRIEALVPDRWSYIPKLQGYFTNMDFKSYGLPDLAPLGWEEWMWRDSLFGFHMRRYNKVKRNFYEEELLLAQVLKI